MNMRKLFFLVAACAFIITTNLGLAAEGKVIKVGDFNSFLKALAPDVTIILTNDIDIIFGKQELATAQKSKYITIAAREEYYQSWEKDWTIKNVSNLKIIGRENLGQENKTKILTKSRFIEALKFSNVKNIELQNLDLRSLSELGGILSFEDSSNIIIKNNSLVGGQNGLELKRVSDLSFENSTIQNYKGSLAIVLDAKNIKFSSSNFKDSIDYYDGAGFTIANSQGIKFENSTFSNLPGMQAIFNLIDEKSVIEISNSKFLNNETYYFSNKSSHLGKQIIEAGNTYQNNGFKTPSKPVILDENMNKKYEKYYVHNLAGIRLYQAIPLNKKDSEGGEIIPYESEVKIIRREGEEIVRNNILGRWAYVKFEGKTGYIFDGFVSYFPVKDEKDFKDYYEKLVDAGINSSLELDISSGEEFSQGYLYCCNNQGYSHYLKLQSCEEKDIFWLFKSYNDIGNFASFPDKNLVKNLIKSGKTSESPKVSNKKWNYWISDYYDKKIKGAIQDPEKPEHMWNQEFEAEFEAEFNKDAEVTLFSFGTRWSEGTGTYNAIERQGKCLWQIEDTASAD